MPLEMPWYKREKECSGVEWKETTTDFAGEKDLMWSLSLEEPASVLCKKELGFFFFFFLTFGAVGLNWWWAQEG